MPRPSRRKTLLRSERLRTRGSAASRPPVRTCVGCGRKAPKAELMRFAAPDRVVIADPAGRASGRGVYTCPRASCYERAASKRAFSRVLRANVRVPAGLNPFSEEG